MLANGTPAIQNYPQRMWSNCGRCPKLSEMTRGLNRQEWIVLGMIFCIPPLVFVGLHSHSRPKEKNIDIAFTSALKEFRTSLREMSDDPLYPPVEIWRADAKPVDGTLFYQERRVRKDSDHVLCYAEMLGGRFYRVPGVGKITRLREAPDLEGFRRF